MSELISSDLRLISVVLQPRLFQFSYTEFKGPIKTALNIWKQKLSFLFINAFPVILEELKSSMPPDPPPPLNFGSDLMRDQTATVKPLPPCYSDSSHEGDFPMRLSLSVERISTLRTSHNSVRGSR